MSHACSHVHSWDISYSSSPWLFLFFLFLHFIWLHTILSFTIPFHSLFNFWKISSSSTKWISLPLLDHKTSVSKQWMYHLHTYTVCVCVCVCVCVVNQRRSWPVKKQRQHTSVLETINQENEAMVIKWAALLLYPQGCACPQHAQES